VRNGSQFAVCVVLILGIVGLAAQGAWAAGKEKAPAATNAPATAAPDSAPVAPGQYKIGVVNRKLVMKGYKKVDAEYNALKADVDAMQAEIDKLSTKIQAAKDKYDKEKDSMSPQERADVEAKVQSDYRQYQAEMQTKQGDIDSKEQRILKKGLTDIDEAVARLAQEGGYYLVLEGSKASAVIFYSPTIDMTQRVIELLNSKP
jgi:outer membrane protein